MSLTESRDAKTPEEYLVEFGVKIGFLTQEKAEQLLKEHPQIVRCKDCKHRPTQKKCFPDMVCPCQCSDSYYSWVPPDDWYCADGERKEGDGE